MFEYASYHPPNRVPLTLRQSCNNNSSHDAHQAASTAPGTEPPDVDAGEDMDAEARFPPSPTVKVPEVDVSDCRNAATTLEDLGGLQYEGIRPCWRDNEKRSRGLAFGGGDHLAIAVSELSDHPLFCVRWTVVRLLHHVSECDYNMNRRTWSKICHYEGIG
jgi:hypothetical protein